MQNHLLVIFYLQLCALFRCLSSTITNRFLLDAFVLACKQPDWTAFSKDFLVFTWKLLAIANALVWIHHNRSFVLIWICRWPRTELVAIGFFNNCIDIVGLFIKNPWRLQITFCSSLLQLRLVCFGYLSWEILLELVLLLPLWMFSLVLLGMRTLILLFPSRMRFILIRCFRWSRVTRRVRMKEHRIRCESNNWLWLVDVILNHLVHENVCSMCSCRGNLRMLLRMHNGRNVWFCIICWFTGFQLVFAVHRFFSLLQQSSIILRDHLLMLIIQWRWNRRLIFRLTRWYHISWAIFTLLFLLIPYEIIRNILTHAAIIIIGLFFSSLLLILPLNLDCFNITNILSFSNRTPKPVDTVPTAVRWSLREAIKLLETLNIRRTLRGLTLKSLQLLQ